MCFSSVTIIVHRVLNFPCSFPVRFIPSWFPGANFKRVAQKAREDLTRVEAIPFELAKSQIVRLLPFLGDLYVVDASTLI